MKVVIIHPSKQHSFQTAKAIKKAGWNLKYITTVYNKDSSFTSKITKLLSGNNKKKSLSRKSDFIDDKDVIQFYEKLALIRLLFSKIPFLSKIDIRSFLFKRFFKKAAKYVINNDVDIVIVYDALSKQYLDLIKKKAPKVKIIMEVTISTHAFQREQFINDMSKYHHSGFYKEEPVIWKDSVLEQQQKEFQAVDYFFAPSEVVIKSLEFCKISKDKIVKIPYGVNVQQFNYVQKVASATPVRLLFVGGLLYRKGLHHLLKVISSYSSKEVILNIAGAISMDNPLYQQYKKHENINFLGFVTRDIITKEFQDSSYFILPSLGEGFGLVTLEALATGTPVICSDFTGGNDAITDNTNGLVIKAGDEDAIRKSVEWAIQNKQNLPFLSENARKSSLGYTWEIYEKNIENELTKIISFPSINK